MPHKPLFRAPPRRVEIKDSSATARKLQVAIAALQCIAADAYTHYDNAERAKKNNAGLTTEPLSFNNIRWRALRALTTIENCPEASSGNPAKAALSDLVIIIRRLCGEGPPDQHDGYGDEAQNLRNTDELKRAHKVLLRTSDRLTIEDIDAEIRRLEHLKKVKVARVIGPLPSIESTP